MSITIIQGDLLAQDVDAIVNPANSHLRHGGGLARKIEAAAMPNRQHRTMWTEPERTWMVEHVDAPLIPTGGAYLTSAGNLPFKGVIHAVGPVWGGGAYYEPSLLMRAHDSALRIAREAGYESVAIPAISCGIFGYPVRQAAMVAISTAISWSRGLDIRFVLFEDEHYDAYVDAALAFGVTR